ncbi:fucolectin-1-like [Triplophysa rosa]|uniref:fucolectin-1-like n=1 Tax=Triplophysa rosa TaxID=992332 RepID=UPI002545D1E9|nr:fucolectin-1-like [Triplophysa rosa]
MQFSMASRDMDKLIHLILLSGLCIPGSLAENLAFKGTVTQSSTYLTWLPQHAIDGVRYGPDPDDVTYCSATTSESDPWWRLDLLDYYDIGTVIITARPDEHLEQTNGAEIRIGNSLDNNGNNNPICAVTSDPLPGQTISYSCHGMEGRYVNVIMPGRTSHLTLCEVEVYGVLRYRQKTFLRLKLSSSVDVAAESGKILHQLQSALASHISDFNLSWTQLPEKEEEPRADRFKYTHFNNMF